MNRGNAVEFLVSNGAIRFGRFTLKSGRQSPYFFNAGALHSGASFLKLGFFYAETIMEHVGSKFDVVHGPAYKGIPLALATVAALHLNFGLNKDYLFDRKIIKDHAEKGAFVGCAPTGDRRRVVLIDDVCTTGETKYAMLDKLSAAFPNVECLALIVAIDREETTDGETNAIREFSEKTGIPVFSIVTAHDIAAYLDRRDPERAGEIRAYLAKYGVEEGYFQPEQLQ